jgi:hypothetical protein
MATSASTYTVQNAADIVAPIHASPGAENIHTACDLALAYMWGRWGWRQSLKELPPFWLVPEKLEYGAPISVVPSDFAGLWEVALVHVRGDGSGPHYQIVSVLSNRSQPRVSRDGSIWPPSSIAYIPEFDVFRLSAPCPSNIAGPEYMIAGTYKIKPTKITGANIGSTLVPFEDKYYGAFVEMVRWKFMQLSGDARAGTMQVFSNGSRQYTGQAALAHDALLMALADEENDDGADQVVPEITFTEW